MLIGLAIVSAVYCQTPAKAKVDTCFTKVEMVKIANTIKDLQNKDTTKTLIIKQLNGQTALWKALHTQDSITMTYKDLKIAILNEKIDLYKDYSTLTKPKWYDSKFVWFTFGSLVILSSFFVYKGAF